MTHYLKEKKRIFHNSVILWNNSVKVWFVFLIVFQQYLIICVINDAEKIQLFVLVRARSFIHFKEPFVWTGLMKTICPSWSPHSFILFRVNRIPRRCKDKTTPQPLKKRVLENSFIQPFHPVNVTQGHF